MPTYEEVLAFATKAHQGQKRFDGTEYISHPIGVAKILWDVGFRSNRMQYTALLHDTIEDNKNITGDDIEELMGDDDDDVTKAVLMLTHWKGQSVRDYLRMIPKCEYAYEVKCADRLYNLRDAKSGQIPWIKKYLKETKDYYFSFSDVSEFRTDIREAWKELRELLEWKKKTL